jgi:hypothetical protein
VSCEMSQYHPRERMGQGFKSIKTQPHLRMQMVLTSKARRAHHSLI